MKKIILSILFISVTSFAQTVSNTNFLKLKNDIKTSSNNITLPQKQNLLLQSGKKNAGLAILYSLLLPGMGELYAGDYSTGKYFTMAEGVLWGTYLGINTYGNWRKERYKSFAASNANVNPTNKNSDYYATIGVYSNIESYNNSQALDRNYSQMYDEQQYYWKWQNDTERRNYRDMWVSSEKAYNNLRFVVGALVLNRIISAVNAVRLVASHNKKLSAEMGWNISMGISNKPTLPSGLNINFHTAF